MFLRTPNSLPDSFVPKEVISAPVDVSSSSALGVFPESEVRPVRILHVGDIMLDRNVKKQIATHGEDYPLGGLASGGFFDGYDIVAGNLEGPFVSRRRETSKEIAFAFDPIYISLLKKYHISLVTLANNHSYDMGGDGFEENKQFLRNAGIDFYGSQYRIDVDSVLIKDVRGQTLAFLGVDDTTSRVDRVKVIAIIQRLRQEADTVIINAHWGAEYKAVSNERQRALAHDWIDAGADIIIGHHPHWVQEVEVYKNRPIFYSLGNFIFDQYFSVETQEGLALDIALAENTITIGLLPVIGEQSRLRVMTGVEKEEFFRKLIERSRLDNKTIPLSFSL